jgi:hypothetical protein
MDFLPDIAPWPPPDDFDHHYHLLITPDMYGNDARQDCVIAARAHHTIRLVWAMSSSQVAISANDVVSEYESENKQQNFGTFNDTGLDLKTSLDEWQIPGWTFGGDTQNLHTIKSHSPAYGIHGGQLPVEGSVLELSPQQLQIGICSNSGAQVNLILPPDVMPTKASTFGPDHLWDDVSDSLGQQHVVLLTGYDANTPPNFVGISWGQKQWMTWGFLQQRSFGMFFVEPGEKI